MADELFKFGEIEGGLQYLGSAVVVEVYPWRLLQSLHKHFSEGAFHLLLINTEKLQFSCEDYA